MDAAPGKEPKALHFGLRVPAFLRWAALRASTDAPVRVALLTAKGLAPWGEALAAGDATQRIARVQALVDYRAAVLAGERRYSPGTSWVAANADADDDESIVAAWAGGDFSTGERDYAPGYAALLGRDWHLHPGSASLDRFRDDARALVACLPKDAGATGAEEDAE
jgi:exodeoxyribonuclease V gamma subunit